MRWVRAYVALGSNLGNREAALALARDRIGELRGTRLLGASRVEETSPLGGIHQPAYLNQMLAIDTTLSPDQLLAACQQIEVEAGRIRGARWASRILDIDLVRYGGLVRSDAVLVLPHPGLPERDFWRRELDELHGAGW